MLTGISLAIKESKRKDCRFSTASTALLKRLRQEEDRRRGMVGIRRWERWRTGRRKFKQDRRWRRVRVGQSEVGVLWKNRGFHTQSIPLRR